ncbi:hypothetical protein LCGC14_1318790, partial [marine sediment metagenome]
MISLKSKITRKLLNYFFLNPKESLYVNELSRNLALDKRNLVKKIKELETEGILKSQARGNLKLYSINRNYKLFYYSLNALFREISPYIDSTNKKIITKKMAQIVYCYKQHIN